MQFQHRHSKPAPFSLRPAMGQVHPTLAPAQRRGHPVQRLSLRPRSGPALAAGLPVPLGSAPAAPHGGDAQTPDCDWESWLDAGGDLLMGLAR